MLICGLSIVNFIKIFLSKQSSLKDEVREIIDGVQKLRENQKATEILKKVCEEIV